MSESENSQAYVLSVLTGDTILVKYSHQSYKYGIILLPVACAPQFSFFFNSAVNDPFAIESLNFLRDHIENKRILVGPPSQSYSGPKIFSHQTLGALPVSINSIRLVDDPNEDIDAYLIQNGFACIRENSPLINDAWFARYEQFQESAYVNKVGIWGNVQTKTLDPQIVNQFEAIIVSLNNDFTFKLLDPGVDVELAGVTEIKGSRSHEFNIFLGERVLFHKANIRILQRLSGAPPVVSISINNFDLGQLLLENHFAVINKITSHLLTNECEIRRELKLNTKCEHEFKAKVIKILSSNSFLIDDYKTIILSHIIVPRFDFTGKSEKYGIEAFRYLRDKILHQTVTISVIIDNVGEVYGIVKVGQQNINQLMVKEGLALIAVSRIQGNQPFYDVLKKELDKATSSKIGIHSKTNPKQESRKVGIIHHITSPKRIEIFVDNELKQYSLQNLTTTDFSYCDLISIVDILKSNFLQHDVEIKKDGSIVDLASNEDIRAPLLKEGLAISINPFSDQLLANSEKEAKTKKVGIHSKSNLTSLNFDDPVIVTNIIDPTTYVVQLQSEMMSNLHKELIQINAKKVDNPNKGQIYVVKINGKIYRCQILDQNRYLLIDFGFVFPINVGEISTCPSNIASIGPQAFCVTLNSCISFMDKKQNELVIKFLWNLFDKKNVYNVKLLNSEIISSVDILGIPSKYSLRNAFIKSGIFMLDHSLKIDDKQIVKDENEAKSAKVGGWTLITK